MIRPPRQESFILVSLHVLGLWAIAVAQPLFDLLGRSPEFFVAHFARPLDILVIVFGLVIVLPSVLIAVVWFGGRYAMRAAVAVLLGALAMQIVKHGGIQTWNIAAPLAVIAGLAAAVAYDRFAAARSVATALSVAVAVVPLIFLTRPGIRGLIAPPETVAPTVKHKPGAGQSAPVVMVVLDEAPTVSFLDADGKIDPVLYPNMARLAQDGIWFRNATAVDDYTPFAVPPILSGRYPRPRSSPTHADHPQTLFTLLGQTHRLEVVESTTRLCPPELCEPTEHPRETELTAVASDLFIVYKHLLFTDDLRAGLPALTDDWASFGATREDEEASRRRERARRPDKFEIALKFADFISRDDTQPTFYFIHTLLSHSPWLWLPTGQRNATRAALAGDVDWWWTNDEWGVLQYYQRHLLQIGAVDRVMGRIIANLEAAGLYDRTLVVVTADHGISFRSGVHRRNFSEETAAEIMNVPLLIKFPAGRQTELVNTKIGNQQISDRNAETIDVAPTVIDALGLELTWKADGVSLLAPAIRERISKRMFFNAARRSRFYARQGPDTAPALQRKLEIFGGSENTYRVLRLERFGELIGRPLTDLRVTDGGGGVSLESGSQFQKVDTHASAVPFDVAGQLNQQRPKDETTYVAVAINGTIFAVTKTWKSQRNKWLATPPLDAWRNGRNDLEVFVIDTDAQGPLLRRTVSGKTRERRTTDD